MLSFYSMVLYWFPCHSTSKVLLASRIAWWQSLRSWARNTVLLWGLFWFFLFVISEFFSLFAFVIFTAMSFFFHLCYDCWSEVSLHVLYLQDSKRSSVWKIALYSQRDLCWWLPCWESYSGVFASRFFALVGILSFLFLKSAALFEILFRMKTLDKFHIALDQSRSCKIFL